MCIYKIAWNAYEYLDVFLDFSPLLLLFGGFYAFWMFIWMLVVFILLWYDEFAWDYVRIIIIIFHKNKRYSFIQIDGVHRYNTNPNSLKTKRMNM